MDLSVIIVSWNVREKLRENLKAIFEEEEKGTKSPIGDLVPAEPHPNPLIKKERGQMEFEVFVVDNDSADGSAEMVAQEFPFVNLIANKENLGFGKANNQAIRQAKGRYILLLNPDMKVFPDTFSNMIKWMDENPRASVAGCNLVDEAGKTVEHVRRFPTLSDQLAIILKLPHLFPGILDKYLSKDFDYTKAQKVDSVRGAFFMIRTSKAGGTKSPIGDLVPVEPHPSPLLKKERGNQHTPDPSPQSFDHSYAIWQGGASKRGNQHTPDPSQEGNLTLPFLDERYFVWFEEVDYCMQVRKAGGEVWYTPVARCIDYVGQSFKQVKRGKTQNYFRESMIKYFKKWHPGYRPAILYIAWIFGSVITYIFDSVGLTGRGKT